MSAKQWLVLPAVIVIGGGAYVGWSALQPAGLPDGFASSNGRVEAVEIDIAAKTPGRLVAVLAHEGDFVTAGQVLAQMDTDVLEAQLQEAKAELSRAQTAVETARSVVSQRETEKTAAEAMVAQREAELELASKQFARAEKLTSKDVMPVEELDTQRAALFGSRATLSSAKANVAGAEAAISTARSQVIQAEATVVAAQARIQRLSADIADCTLKAPRDGRVQFRIAQPGEVLNAGGKVLNMVDLTDVYITFFLSEVPAGRVQLGGEVRVILDSAPQYVSTTRVTFVADVAQFTPKTVETAEERQKLMFRVKAHVDPEFLRQHIRNVKTGMPGTAYVQLDPRHAWPAHLEVRLPQ